MPSTPYPFTGTTWEEAVKTVIAMFRDLYENRLGGAEVGDVFEITGDTLTLKLKDGSGLQKTNGELDIDIDTIGTNGAVMQSHYDAKGTLVTATAASTISVLPVGSNTNVLKADSAVARGIKWGGVEASEVINTPAGDIAATNVQAALNELDTEKAPKASPVHTGITTDASLKVSDLTSGKYPIASTDGQLVDGPAPLAGTKIYYVADSSGGDVTRKLTFVDGILTAET